MMRRSIDGGMRDQLMIIVIVGIVSTAVRQRRRRDKMTVPLLAL